MKKILILLIVCLCCTGCFSTKKYHVATNEDVKQTLSSGDITVTCEFLDEGYTNSKFGKESNPYMTKEFALTPISFFVFEVEFVNNTSMVLKYDCREAEFSLGDVDARAMTLGDFETYMDGDDDTSGATKLKMERIVRSTMYKNVQRIMPGETVKKYIVFKDNYRQRGDGHLEISLMYQNGNIADTFAFDYTFQKLRKGDKPVVKK